MEESLRGQLLVASPALVDPNFARTVVFITEHSEEGAMGIVLDRPSETAVEALVPQLAEIAGGEPVYVGGPVQPEAIVLLAEFSDLEAAAWIAVADVGLASADVDLDELAAAVRRRRVLRRLFGMGADSSRPEMDRLLDRRGACRRSSSPTTPQRCGATCWRGRAGSTR